MRYILLFFFCFLLITKLSAQLADTIVEARWNGHTFNNSFRTINTYDAMCNLITERDQFWDVESKKWINNQLTAYAFSGNNLDTTVRQNWNNVSHSWNNIYRVINTYNNSKLISRLNETWHTNTWQDSSLQTEVYNAGKNTASIVKTWDTVLNIWRKLVQTNFAYNTDNTLKQSVTQIWDTVTSAWNNFYKQTYGYTINKTINRMVYQIWDTVSKTWMNQSKNIYSDSVSFFQLWQENKWLSVLRTTFTHDENHFLLETLYETWNNNTWSNNEKIVYTNNSDGKPHLVIYQLWNVNDGKWVNDIRFTYFYIPGCTFPIALSRPNDKNRLIGNYSALVGVPPARNF